MTITPRFNEKMTPDYLWCKVRCYCDRYGINREELALTTGKSISTISNYNSKPGTVTLDTIYRFCNAYHIQSLADLEKM